jgi:hypothetical protein
LLANAKTRLILSESSQYSERENRICQQYHKLVKKGETLEKTDGPVHDEEPRSHAVRNELVEEFIVNAETKVKQNRTGSR